MWTSWNAKKWPAFVPCPDERHSQILANFQTLIKSRLQGTRMMVVRLHVCFAFGWDQHVQLSQAWMRKQRLILAKISSSDIMFFWQLSLFSNVEALSTLHMLKPAATRTGFHRLNRMINDEQKTTALFSSAQFEVFVQNDNVSFVCRRWPAHRAEIVVSPWSRLCWDRTRRAFTFSHLLQAFAISYWYQCTCCRLSL